MAPLLEELRQYACERGLMLRCRKQRHQAGDLGERGEAA